MASDREAQYDAKAKHILSQKIILAHILSETVKEFEGMSPEEIVPLIEGDPYVGCVPVDPGLTNVGSSTKGKRIVGLNTENLEVNEGLCIFDIIFYVRMRDGQSTTEHQKKRRSSNSNVVLRKMIINIEAQREQRGNYQLLNRGIFYNCRMISSQKEREFLGENYDDVFWRGQMDAINVYMLGVGKKLPEYDEGHKLHRLLGTIFSTTLSWEEKSTIMEQEYNITLEDEIGRDVKDMCSLSQYVKEEGIEIGMKRGIEKGMTKERERSEKLLAEKDRTIAEKDALIDSLRRKLAFYL